MLESNQEQTAAEEPTKLRKLQIRHERSKKLLECHAKQLQRLTLEQALDRDLEYQSLIARQRILRRDLHFCRCGISKKRSAIAIRVATLKLFRKKLRTARKRARRIEARIGIVDSAMNCVAATYRQLLGTSK